MPVNLADLPTDKPFPNGKVQIKRGAADTTWAVTSGTPAQKLPDGAGGFMQISYTPRYSCYWIVRGNMMAVGAVDGVAWRRLDWSIMISPADANGITEGQRGIHQVHDSNPVQWDTVGVSCAFALAPGIAYTASLWHFSVTAGTTYYHTGPAWFRIVGQIVGEGAI